MDENGVVHKDFNETARATTTNTLPAYHQREFIRAGCTLVTTGFSQTENYYYMPSSETTNVCHFIEDCSTATQLAADIAATYTGPVGTGLAAVVMGMTVSTLSSIAADISDLLNANKLVRLCVTSSQYGQFASVSEWNGYSCIRYGYVDGATSYTVNSVVCERHRASVWG